MLVLHISHVIWQITWDQINTVNLEPWTLNLEPWDTDGQPVDRRNKIYNVYDYLIESIMTIFHLPKHWTIFTLLYIKIPICACWYIFFGTYRSPITRPIQELTRERILEYKENPVFKVEGLPQQDYFKVKGYKINITKNKHNAELQRKPPPSN
jgi:hypothetical protein